MDPIKLITSMVPFVMQQLASPAITEIAKVWNVDKEVGELLATYARIKDMLDKWESRLDINDVSLSKWSQELEGYLYDTEDLVDLLTLSCTTSGEDENQSKYPIRIQLLTSFSIKPLTTPHKIVELRDNLERVSSWIEKFLGNGLTNSKQLDPEAQSNHHYKSLLSDEMPFMCGTRRDKDKKTIIEKLIVKCNRSGVCIAGIDGLGKTSLARAIMVDDTVKSHFPLLLYASVSGDFHMTGIVQDLVASYSDTTSPQPTDTYRGDDKILRDLLCRERSLIILDDLWSVKDEDWQRFQRNYLNLSPGGKVLITSPSREVAEKTKSFAHDLGIMTDEDCKKLIMESGELSQFEGENLARDLEVIARKCHGLPIIANKLGLELSRKHNMHEKKDRLVELKNCNLWELRDFRKVFLSLNLSELKMPLHLKRCFAYFSLFPPDHEFNKDELIQFWEVEGFIQPQDRIASKAVVRKECFDDILSRSIIHPNKSRGNEPPVYKMLEFRHWFAQLLASKTFCRVNEGTSSTLSSCQHIRHLSLTNCQNIDKLLLKKIEKCKGLRTFLLLHQNNNRPLSITHNFFEKLQSLRLLDLSLTNITTLSRPASLSKHLRYLDLSNTLVDKLPKQIQCFRALQVLKLINCSKLLQLPKELNQLISLTHLHFSVKKLGCPLSNMGKLTNLEVLESFFVGNDEGCKVSELENMKNLTKLHIFGLDYIRDKVEVTGAMLNEKPLLKTLVLEWKDVKAKSAEEVIEGLQPHDDLNNLEVRNYGGKLLPIWLTSPTCQLVSIYLDNFPYCEAIPSLGQLPILKNLVLRSIGSVTALDSQFCGQGERVFPCLELLEFHGMERLVNWTGLKEGDMPCLRALKIVGCLVLLSLPSFTHLNCLMNLEINNCPDLQLLPELPLSLNGESGKLIIANSALVKARCQNGKVDWAKIKDIPYVEIHATRIQTKSSSQHPTNDKPDKDQVSMNENQSPTFDKLMYESNVSQVHQDEVSRSEECPIALPRPGAETHTSEKTPSEDQPTSAHLQPTPTTTTNEIANKNHILQDEVQRNNGFPHAPSATASLNSQKSEQDPLTILENEMVQNLQDELSNKEHDSTTHQDLADESCNSQNFKTIQFLRVIQNEEPTNNPPPSAPYKQVDEIFPTPENQTQSSYGNPSESSPKRSNSLGFGCLFKGCFSKVG